MYPSGLLRVSLRGRRAASYDRPPPPSLTHPLAHDTPKNQALNKLMGKAIYTSNDQLGGQMIMFPNGVSHLLAENHLEGVVSVLTWLRYDADADR